MAARAVFTQRKDTYTVSPVVPRSSPYPLYPHWASRAVFLAYLRAAFAL